MVQKIKEIGAMSTYAIMADKMLQIGDQFDRYQIQAHMAQGGMSDIYRAFDLVNRREVVIKIPDPSMIGDPAQFERFQRELEVMTTLNHPTILKGLGSGKYNRIPYLVTQYVDGQSLRKLIEDSAPLSPERAVSLIRKIADGMAYCHKNNVIHRDLKPENILITTGDQRTDEYALGTILYEMLAGKTPFTGDSNMAIMAQHLHNTAQRLDWVNPLVSPQLAAIVATCLALDPEDRYADMDALIEALDHPENVDVTILDKLNAPTADPRSLTQLQVIQ